MVKNQELLKDGRVIEEINRHRWFESEKAGTDVGFEKASADWLNRFSDEWIKHNKAEKTAAVPKRKAKTVGKK